MEVGWNWDGSRMQVMCVGWKEVKWPQKATLTFLLQTVPRQWRRNGRGGGAGVPLIPYMEPPIFFCSPKKRLSLSKGVMCWKLSSVSLNNWSPPIEKHFPTPLHAIP